MLISLYFMQCENGAAALWEFLQSAPECDAIDDAGQFRIALAEITMERRGLRVHRLVKRTGRRGFSPPELHQHCVDGNAIQPRRKCGISAERTDGAEHLQESFLRQVFRLCY